MTECERIGGVTLDYIRYSSKDSYSDGEVEEELLEIVKNECESEFNRIINEKKSWPILYHLSNQRQNIIEWMPLEKQHKILEIGSGCGAITNLLARRGGKVDGIELSKRRSLINAYRNRDYDNITIHVGNFQNIEPTLDYDYDYVIMIGVWEYAQSYIQSPNPYREFLDIGLKHLKPGGKLMIAIENKLGLKYWAGCKEDHLASFFSGIEGYTDGEGVRTFSKKEIENILEKIDGCSYVFYYPYPDYKLCNQIFTDDRLPVSGELAENIRNFDQDRMVVFQEEKAYESILEAGLFPEFSNSFLIEVKKGQI